MTKNCQSQHETAVTLLTLRSSSVPRVQIAGFIVVLLSMVEMFTIPKSYFVLGSIVSTSTMVCVAYLVIKPEKMVRPKNRNLVLAVLVAIALYAIFLAGNAAVKAFPLFGISTSSEQSIYGLFNKVPLPILIVVLILDAFGFESYFRGNVLTKLSTKIGAGSVFAAAAIDALIHISTLNPLFPPTTFIADSVWGTYYYKTRDIGSTIVCHFVWDIMIFVLFPIH